MNSNAYHALLSLAVVKNIDDTFLLMHSHSITPLLAFTKRVATTFNIMSFLNDVYSVKVAIHMYCVSKANVIFTQKKISTVNADGYSIYHE